MTRPPLPDTTIDPSLKRKIDAIAQKFVSVEDAEITALTADIVGSLRSDPHWIAFCDLVTSTIRHSGYIVVRGLDADEGRSLLIVSAALGATFDGYGARKIVKRFRLSPWTDELSHTIRAGDFHTDGNVSAVPPMGTAMQCEHEDPGAPEYAEQRIAYLPYLLDRLASGTFDDREAFSFLMEAVAAMAHERSPDLWRGHLVQNGTIRYHPQSLRIASKRLNEQSAKLESAIAAIHRAATDVSVPFHTRAGDTVLVSNRTALHYRGACSVRFRKFPTEFDSRSLLVLHLKEPAA
jgi:Taurine catabolism dioxygenase TauD, TfdA family